MNHDHDRFQAPIGAFVGGMLDQREWKCSTCGRESVVFFQRLTKPYAALASDVEERPYVGDQSKLVAAFEVPSCTKEGKCQLQALRIAKQH